MKTCLACQQSLPEDNFYTLKSHGNKDQKFPYCKKCATKKVKKYQQSFKRLCLEYKGKSCEICGYSRCEGALEFHHKDPSEKEFSISSIRISFLSEEIKKELDKCMVLCSNCHKEVHYVLGEGIEPSYTL